MIQKINFSNLFNIQKKRNADKITNKIKNETNYQASKIKLNNKA